MNNEIELKSAYEILKHIAHGTHAAILINVVFILNNTTDDDASNNIYKYIYIYVYVCIFYKKKKNKKNISYTLVYIYSIDIYIYHIKCYRQTTGKTYINLE